MADWEPTDWDPDAEAQAANRRGGSLGAANSDTVNSWLRAEWQRFEARMKEWATEHWKRTGVDVSDADKRLHRRRCHELLCRTYGRSVPDEAWTRKCEEQLAKRDGGGFQRGGRAA